MPWLWHYTEKSQFDWHFELNSCTVCPESHTTGGEDLVHGLGCVSLFLLGITWLW